MTASDEAWFRELGFEMVEEDESPRSIFPARKALKARKAPRTGQHDPFTALTALTALTAQPKVSQPSLEKEALQGPAGEWAIASQPYTEASVAGILAATLVAFGSAVGRTPYAQVAATRHYVNEFVLLVGRTATGRKGEAGNVAMHPLRMADGAWATRVLGGFGSGEAVVDELRDPLTTLDEEGNEKTLDAGAEDKRLLVHEPEFASVIAIAGRDGSILSQLIRNGFDGVTLANRTKGRRLVASNAHLAILSGITPEELLRNLPATELANGFLNRFLLVAVTRSKHLPSPPVIPYALENEFSTRFALALTFARKVGRMDRDQEAGDLWDRAYVEELSIDRDGLAGAVCSRAEVHVLRLSMIYALLDQSETIRCEHVAAALALWRYAEETAFDVFGDRLGDPDADAIIEALDRAGDDGMTRDQIRDLFSRHRSAKRLSDALGRLVALSRIVESQEKTDGRPATRYHHARWARRAEEDDEA